MWGVWEDKKEALLPSLPLLPPPFPPFPPFPHLPHLPHLPHPLDFSLVRNPGTAPVVEVEEKPVAISEPRVPDYVPLLDNPPVQSVGNSGWQVSDVWRDIRVDDFCG